MIELLSYYFFGSEPECYYRVEESTTTLTGVTHECSAVFKGSNLLICKSNAERYFDQQLQSSKLKGWLLPNATDDEFILGKHSYWSIDLYFVINYGDDDCKVVTLRNNWGGQHEEERELEAHWLARALTFAPVNDSLYWS